MDVKSRRQLKQTNSFHSSRKRSTKHPAASPAVRPTLPSHPFRNVISSTELRAALKRVSCGTAGQTMCTISPDAPPENRIQTTSEVLQQVPSEGNRPKALETRYHCPSSETCSPRWPANPAPAAAEPTVHSCELCAFVSNTKITRHHLRTHKVDRREHKLHRPSNCQESAAHLLFECPNNTLSMITSRSTYCACFAFTSLDGDPIRCVLCVCCRMTEQDADVVPMLQLGNEGSQFVLRRWLRLLLCGHASFHP